MNHPQNKNKKTNKTGERISIYTKNTIFGKSYNITGIWERANVHIDSVYCSHDSKLHKINSYKLGINKHAALKYIVKNKTLTIRS